MNYISTRGDIKPIRFSDAVLMGMASDGGLILPAEIPDFSSRLDELASLSYRDLCLELMNPFVDMERSQLAAVVNRSYDSFAAYDVVEMKKVGPYHVLELFHGPTLAFKDLALQFLGNAFESILASRGGKLNILAATSGDTGSAAIQGLRKRAGISIFVMHPHNRVSRLQELQMTSVLDPNVHNIAIEGTFDDCQAVMKEIFADLEFKAENSLGSVNSINWARLLAQIVYYFYAALRVRSQDGADTVAFAVPTGNFGDIFAGYMAHKMGCPISQLILATNRNDILTRFFQRGDYSCSDVIQTLSPSMDIQVASNFERYLYYRCGRDPEQLKALMTGFAASRALDAASLPETDSLFCAGRADDVETLSAISRVYEEHDYLLDPHSATAWKVAEDSAVSEPVVCICTAHPAKFPEAVKQAVGKDIARHPSLDALDGLKTRCSVLTPDAKTIKTFITERAG